MKKTNKKQEIYNEVQTPLEVLWLSEWCLEYLKLDNLHTIEDIINYKETSVSYPSELIKKLKERWIII